MSDRMTRVPGAASGNALRPGVAVLVGHLWCSVPSTLFFVAAVWLSGMFTHPDNILWIPLVVGVVAGWIWFAVTVPRWRRWALRRGAPEERTRKLAKRTLLNWPTEEEADRFRGPHR
jgi:hypothetical protein